MRVHWKMDAAWGSRLTEFLGIIPSWGPACHLKWSSWTKVKFSKTMKSWKNTSSNGRKCCCSWTEVPQYVTTQSELEVVPISWHVHMSGHATTNATVREPRSLYVITQSELEVVPICRHAKICYQKSYFVEARKQNMQEYSNTRNEMASRKSPGHK